MDKLKLTIDSSMTGRIDKELAHHITGISRSQLQKWIEDGNVTVNGTTVKPKYKLAVGDEVVVQPEKPQKIDLEPENIPLDIVYEDDDVIVVNKPQGMVVHPAPGHPNHTLVNAL
ncbi:S4 domain-containing protein, partial [Limosilactobacillus sp.]